MAAALPAVRDRLLNRLNGLRSELRSQAIERIESVAEDIDRAGNRVETLGRFAAQSFADAVRPQTGFPMPVCTYSSATNPAEMVAYNNAVVTLTSRGTPDPFLVHALGLYVLTFTAGDHIELWAADSLVGFEEKARKIHVWQPPPNTPYSSGLWAPELHSIQGRWYIYFAGAQPDQGNISHRMYVLEGPASHTDPTLGPWEFLGPIQGIPTDQWAIDGTVFPLNNELFFVYSGWPLGEKQSELIQELFIVRLANPVRTTGEPPVRISTPQESWEFTHGGDGAHGINEGPQFLSAPANHDESGGTPWSGIVYSCAGSWTNQYKMAILRYNANAPPLEPSSWSKETVPLCQSPGHGAGPWGPGHGNFLNLGGETIAVFHATDKPHDGWKGRKARVQRVGWGMHGPFMGSCVGDITGDIGDLTKRDLEGKDSSAGLRAMLHSANAKLAGSET